MSTARLHDKAGICAYLGDISPTTYDKWQARGLVPGPVRGTNRYDVRAHDAALDRASGLTKTLGGQSRVDPLDEFLGSHAH
jgi:hypothetical protein